MKIDAALLEANNWRFASDVWWHTEIIEGCKFRIGWTPATGKTYVGYGQMPRPLFEVDDMNDLLRLCGCTQLQILP